MLPNRCQHLNKFACNPWFHWLLWAYICPGATLFILFQCKKGKLTYPLLPLYPPPLLLTLPPILQPIVEAIEQAKKLVFIRVSAEKGTGFRRKNSSGKRCSEWFQITLFALLFRILNFAPYRLIGFAPKHCCYSIKGNSCCPSTWLLFKFCYPTGFPNKTCIQFIEFIFNIALFLYTFAPIAF